jgi:hypothetical protein
MASRIDRSHGVVGSYRGVSTLNIIEDGLAPNDFRQGSATAMSNAWRGAVTVSPATVRLAGDAFAVGLSALPSRACVPFVSALAGDVDVRDVNYSGNNPNKFRADIEAAKATLARVERALKDTGVLPRTAQEQRDAALDKAYPNALTRQIVEWERQRFQKRYTPVATSRLGKTVREWKGFWVPLAD